MRFLPKNAEKSPPDQAVALTDGMNNRIWPVFPPIFKSQTLMRMSLICHDICVMRMLRRNNEN